MMSIFMNVKFFQVVASQQSSSCISQRTFGLPQRWLHSKNHRAWALDSAKQNNVCTDYFYIGSSWFADVSFSFELLQGGIFPGADSAIKYCISARAHALCSHINAAQIPLLLPYIDEMCALRRPHLETQYFCSFASLFTPTTFCVATTYAPCINNAGRLCSR